MMVRRMGDSVRHGDWHARKVASSVKIADFARQRGAAGEGWEAESGRVVKPDTTVPNVSARHGGVGLLSYLPASGGVQGGCIRIPRGPSESGVRAFAAVQCAQRSKSNSDRSDGGES